MIGAVAQTGGAVTTSSRSGSAALGEEDFLKLLTAQLQTQDPFDPLDNSQMVAQMAQFSQVAGIAEINSSLKTLVSSLGGGRINDAASWIGRGCTTATPSAGKAAR